MTLLHPAVAKDVYPIGAIISGNAPPNSNWLRMEGQILAKASYTKLVNALETDNPDQWQDLTVVQAQTSSNGLTTCLSNGTRLVAVGYNGELCYTTDGDSWTDSSFANTTPSYYCLCWTGTIFYTIGYNSTQAYSSTDGVSWTSRTMSASNSYIGVAWDGTYLIAIASGSVTTYRSTDGITWNSTGNLSGTGFDGIASDGAGTCVTVNGSIVNVTVDGGATWKKYIIGYGTTNGLVTYCNGYFIIPGLLAGGKTFFSDDGITWEQVHHNYGLTIDAYDDDFNPNLNRYRYMDGQYFGIPTYSHWGVRSPDLKSFYPWYLHGGDMIEMNDAGFINDRICCTVGGGDHIYQFKEAKFDTATYFQLPRDIKSGMERDNFGRSYYIRAK